MNKVRTRFAPSPTGFLHVGGIRTALFAWLLATQNNGDFILRIEDTDQAREVSGSADHIQESLQWLGLEWNEGPFYQSERLEIYKKWAHKLIDSGRAYADPYSSAEVQDFREQAQREKRVFLYRHHRPENPPAWDGTQPLRLKSEPRAYEWKDLVMGDMHAGEEVVDDFIIMKSDGFPTYNFAHIVDDAEMEITHIIRGQEFVASTPNYLNLYEALSLEFPIFASVPPIMNEQGNKKLSKRDGAKDILQYREEGYLPEAMRNFLASLGWNDGTEQEVFTTDEIIEKFSLDRVQKSGARFDERRLLWMNGQIIRQLSDEVLYEKTSDFWPIEANESSEEFKKQVLDISKERLKTLEDLRGFGYFFSEPKINMDLIDGNKQLKKIEPTKRNELIKQSHDALQEMVEWNADSIQATLNNLIETTGEKPGILFSLIRIYTTWAPFSPQLNETLALIGKETTLSRLNANL